MRKPLSCYHPILYWLRVQQKRIFRRLAWACSSRRYAQEKRPDQRLDHRFIKHTSKLIRQLGDSDIALQHNKVINLRLATEAIGGIIIGPGEYFSFCQLVESPAVSGDLLRAWNYHLVKLAAGLAEGFAN
ncbi:VanW family protein [Budvicia aquatica]|uniref:Uncharacterized vancomycin resistance protein n=1 Tax=Budvicia aquatica TaxID=82979 RepID=A0A484ZLT4_9GAMM|nr:VanW family protein [Budvicia aquatica]VFS49577.1 Uncharacterized vancomycin resistance protein [Budvicia aquatica]